MLGDDPATGLQVTLRSGRFGPYVQLGPDAEKGGEKPKRASIPKGWAVEDLDLEAALKLLSLPREIGIHPETGKPIVAGIGRYGPFVENDGKYANLDSVDEVFTVGAKPRRLAAGGKEGRARRALRPRRLKELGEHPTLGGPVTVRSGRYGPYVNHAKINATLPRTHEAGGRDAGAGRRAACGARKPRDGPAQGTKPAQAPAQSASRAKPRPARAPKQPRPRSRRNRRLARKPKQKSAAGASQPRSDPRIHRRAIRARPASARSPAPSGSPAAQRIGLKRLLKRHGRRRPDRRARESTSIAPGDLPSVTVLAVEGIDDQGEPIGVPVEWDEEWGAAPRIVIAPEPKAARAANARAGHRRPRARAPDA